MASIEAPRKGPEGQYNPRKFMVMATKPIAFRNELPDIVNDLAELPEGTVSTPRFDQMSDSIKKIRTEAPAKILDVLYTDFAYNNGWTVPSDKLMQDIGLPTKTQPMESLSPEQRREWEMYRYAGDVPREVALNAFQFAVLIPFDQLPSTKYALDPVIEKLDAELRKVPFQLASKFFPGMTDPEAKKLFGRTVTQVLKRAQEE
ncbi:MAG TPA: hypothetical protein VE090_03330 [Methylomirabilota bacterium]|nr:hypothetical protein [Methylomirabilota bacterium]